MECEDETHSRIHTFAWSRVHKRTYISGRASLKQFQERHYIHTQVAVYWRLGWWWQTHTPMDMIDYLHKHTYVSRCVSLTIFTGAFPLHSFSVTRNFRTYFTSVCPVVLVKPVVQQTVLWDIRAWSSRFLVSLSARVIEWQPNCFVFILLQRYHSVATSNGGISASAICYLWRFVFCFNM